MYNITFDKNHRICKNYDNAQIPGNNRYGLQKIARFKTGKKKNSTMQNLILYRKFKLRNILINMISKKPED